MRKKTAVPDDAKISLAALQLAAQGWKSVTIEAVARKTKIPLATLKKRFPAPCDFVSLVAADIDRAAFVPSGKTGGDVHDVLFDLLMARFDVLQKHRRAIIHMAAAARADKKLACALGRATLDSVYRVINAARLDAPPRPVLAAGLAAIYGWSFYAWQKDESRDMAKTMAALDRALRLAGKAAALITQRS